jgi:uncharacterized protein
MRTPLQEQLLKAGLVKKSRAAEIAREQSRKRKGKAAQPDGPEPVDARKLQAERAERDRAIAQERNARARDNEVRAQIRQIVEAHRVGREGEIEYGFTDGARIRRIQVDHQQRAQLARGALVIVRHDDSYELLPRAAADRVRERDPSMIVLDHATSDNNLSADELDPYYSRFKVPDDLTW